MHMNMVNILKRKEGSDYVCYGIDELFHIEIVEGEEVYTCNVFMKGLIRLTK